MKKVIIWVAVGILAAVLLYLLLRKPTNISSSSKTPLPPTATQPRSGVSIAAASAGEKATSISTASIALVGHTPLQPGGSAAPAPASHSALDIINGAYYMLYYLPRDNYNLAAYNTRFNNVATVTRQGLSLSTIITKATLTPAQAASVLAVNTSDETAQADALSIYNDLARSYINQITGYLNKMLDVTKQDAFNARLSAIVAKSGTSYTLNNTAQDIISLWHDCRTELISETIVQIDAQIYAPYANCIDKMAKTKAQLQNLDNTWEAQKWSLYVVDNNALTVVPSYVTSSGWATAAGGRGTDGQGRVYLTWAGTTYYQYQSYDDAITGLNTFIAAWQKAKNYQAASNGAAAIGFATLVVTMLSGNFVGTAATLFAIDQ